MRLLAAGLLAAPIFCFAVSVCSAVQSGPDLAGSWQSVELLAPAPKPNQRTTIEGLFVVRNEGGRSAPPSRVSIYLRPDRTGVNVRDASVSRFLRTLNVPTLIPGQRWNGRIAYELEPGLDAAGLRLTVVLDASWAAADVNRSNNEVTSSPIAPRTL